MVRPLAAGDLGGERLLVLRVDEQHVVAIVVTAAWAASVEWVTGSTR